MKTILEYVWLGANNELRSKTKVVSGNINFIKDVPQWSFDGSSTGQAPGDNSDCILNPVKLYPNPFQDDYLVMCEVLVNGSKNFYLAHDTNKRSQIHGDSQTYWFGFEQEYVIWKDGSPIGFPSGGKTPKPQGSYYCGVGSENVAGRDFVDEHMQACLHAELDIKGTNAEVMIGQWEYQLFGHGAKESADDLWMSRYILERLAEQYEYDINYHPKPVKGDWNGSGLHTNFSIASMRNMNTNMGTFYDIIDKLEKRHNEHIAVYGKDNDQRLTGLHETQSIDKFTYGESDRGSSIRIPVQVIESGYTEGYLEDRRPAANANPYEITKAIIDTIT